MEEDVAGSDLHPLASLCSQPVLVRVAQGWLPALGQRVPFHRLPDGQALHFPLDPIRTQPGAVFSVAQM